MHADLFLEALDQLREGMAYLTLIVASTYIDLG